MVWQRASDTIRGIGGAKYGDFLAATWNIYVESSKRYASLDMDVPGRMIGAMRMPFSENGLTFLSNPLGDTCARPIEHSVGEMVAIERSNGEERLSPETQIPPYCKRPAVIDGCEWPVLDQSYRTPGA